VLGELKLAHPTRTLELAIDGDAVGYWDAKRLGRVFSNVVGNAIEHGDGPVRLDVCDTGDFMTLHVRNSGKPISGEAIATLFEPFRRGSGSHGWGLGLYIARDIVRAHGGWIDVTSTIEETVFGVHLPKGLVAPHAVPMQGCER